MIYVYVPSLLSESERAKDPRAVVVWVEIYRTEDELAAQVVADEHLAAGFQVRVART